jgi:DNA-binding beta-propeller fold protein YncE
VLVLYDAATLRRLGSATAGSGPAGLASDGGHYLYVTDATAGAVLVYGLVPAFSLVRRYPLAGGPYAIAFDDLRNLLWVTQPRANTVAELSAGRRPRRLRGFPSVRGARAVAVDADSGRVFVTGTEQLQLLDPPDIRRSR